MAVINAYAVAIILYNAMDVAAPIAKSAFYHQTWSSKTNNSLSRVVGFFSVATAMFNRSFYTVRTRNGVVFFLLDHRLGWLFYAKYTEI